MVFSCHVYHYQFVSTDPNLNVETLMPLLSSLSVDRLGDCLLILDSKSAEIEEKSSTEEERRRELINYFLRYSADADFADLSNDLHLWEKTSALEKVKPYVQRVPGMSYIVSTFGVEVLMNGKRHTHFLCSGLG